MTTSTMPPWSAFVPAVFDVLISVDEMRRKDLITAAVESMHLDEAASAELLPSGVARSRDRAQWAIVYLARADYIKAIRRGTYQITDAGRAWSAQLPRPVTDTRAVERHLNAFWTDVAKEPDPAVHAPSAAPMATDSEQTPTEQVQQGIARLNAQIAAELLDKLRGNDPDFFEDAVVKLLLEMGYGGSEQRGRRIGGTGDGGVDGVIDQDALGLDQVYIQAKRYQVGNSVGRPEIQGFVGALHGFGASRGVFITTSAFTQGAVDYAKGVPTRIVLIDGARLASLMIKHKVGVQVVESYDVVRVDEDFFG